MNADVLAKLNELHRRVDHFAQRETDDCHHHQAQIDDLRRELTEVRGDVRALQHAAIAPHKAA